MIRVTVRDKAIKLIKAKSGVIRTAEAINSGIHPRVLYRMRDNGELEQVSRGVYRLTDLPPISSPDVVTVASRAPKVVICILSALSFHGLTTQVPKKVHIAIGRNDWAPKIDYPPLEVYEFSQKSFVAGVELHKLDGVPVRVYSKEKTLADCFKFRNKLGMDIVLEAMKMYKSERQVKVNNLLKYAHICRVEKIMKPYIEAML